MITGLLSPGPPPNATSRSGSGDPEFPTVTAYPFPAPTPLKTPLVDPSTNAMPYAPATIPPGLARLCRMLNDHVIVLVLRFNWLLNPGKFDVGSVVYTTPFAFDDAVALFVSTR